MPTEKRTFGDEGEKIAEAFLRARGFRVMARQARVGRLGELDLVALDGGTLVFIEVKTRRSSRFGAPEDAVTPSKLRHLGAAIEAYRQAKGLEARPYRLDVVAVDLCGAAPAVRHLRAVALE